MRNFLVLLFAVFLLFACDTTPPDTDPKLIAQKLINKTRVVKVDNTTLSNGYTINGHTNYVFHRNDGVYTRYQINYFEDNYKDYGTWSVRTGQVCYLRNGASKPSCRNIYPDGTGVKFSSGFLRDGDIGGTQRRNGVKRLGKPATLGDLVKGLNDLGKAIGASPVGTVLGGMANACQNIDCSGGSTSATPTRETSGGVSTASASSKKTASGYRIFETYNYSTGQEVIARGKCNNGKSFSVRFYPNNGNGAKDHGIYSLFGSSVDDVANKFCA